MLGKESRKMAYSALEVAKYVINHEHNNGREISNLRLQKLLYFVQAKVLVETGDPCFDDVMEAWDYGPVVPVVYHKYKIYGSWDIQISDVLVDIEDRIRTFIDAMLDYCRNYPTYQLVEITHKQDPWIQAHQRGTKSEIRPSAIKQYFLSKNSK